MAEEFLTIPEVARLLRIGQRTTYELARKGKLGGAIKVGNQWRVDQRALRRWIDLAGIESGPVFRTIDAGGNVLDGRASDRAVDRAIKRAAKRAGLDDRGFSGHSLRAGLATQAALNGHDAASIARQTGHRSLDTVLGYIRVATRFDANVTKAIGL